MKKLSDLFQITVLVSAGKDRNIKYKYLVNLDVC